MSQITIEVPERSLAVLDKPVADAGSEIGFLAAAKLYEVGRLSSGAAAEFAGLPKPLFLTRLAELNIPVATYTLNDFTKETRLA